MRKLGSTSHGVYAVYDLKAEAYMRPFFCPTRGVAIRAFTMACIVPDDPMAKHPEDYVLYEVGTWDEIDGSLSSIGDPLSVISARDAIRDYVRIRDANQYKLDLERQTMDTKESANG